MITTSEKLSMRKLELELAKLPCKEEDHLLNIGKHHQQVSLNFRPHKTVKILVQTRYAQMFIK